MTRRDGDDTEINRHNVTTPTATANAINVISRADSDLGYDGLKDGADDGLKDGADDGADDGAGANVTSNGAPRPGDDVA